MSAYGYLATANDTYALAASGGSGAVLHGISVGTGATSAVVTVYNGSSASGAVVATIDASAAKDINFHCLRLANGLFVKLTAGNAKVTVIAE